MLVPTFSPPSQTIYDLHVRKDTSSTSSTTSSSTSTSSRPRFTRSSSATSSSATSSSTSSSSGSSSKSKFIGAIVGGAIGGVIVLITLSVLFSAYRRRRNDARKRPRGSVCIGTTKATKGYEQKRVNNFISNTPLPPPAYLQHTNSVGSFTPLIASGQHRANSIGTVPSANDRLQSPHSDDGHGHGLDDRETVSVPPSNPYSGNDFRRMSLVRPDFSLAALEASIAGSPKSLRPPHNELTSYMRDHVHRNSTV